MKKLLSMFLVLCTAMTLLPVSAMAEEAHVDTKKYPIYVRGIQVTDTNKDDVLVDGGSVKYDSTTNTLTLTNAYITYNGGDTIYTRQQDLIVELHGVNIVKSTSTGNDCAFNTISGGNMTFRGTGSLTASGKYGGIYGFNNITIESGTINATGNIAGISSNRGALTITGGNVEATAKTSGGYGIGRDHGGTLSLTVSGNATLTSIGQNGAKAASKITVNNTTHNVMAGYNKEGAKPVQPFDDISAWEKAYVKLTPGNTISGTITFDGNPLMGVSVQIQKEGEDFGAPAITGADGKYTTQTVPDGDYTIKVSKLGYNDAYIADINVSGSPMTGKDQNLTVASLTGTITISGTPKFGEMLTAAYEPGNNTGTLSYQWKRDNIEIGIHSNTYILEEDDIGQTLTCEVTSDVQTGSVSSDGATIAKADGLAITEVISVEGCTTPENDDGKLIGVTSAMEYKKFSDASYTSVSGSAISVSGSAISVSGSAITGLTSGDYMVRYAETDTHKAGPNTIFTVASFSSNTTFIPVTDITMTNASTVQAGSSLILTGSVTPVNATNRIITWSIEDANGTGAIITRNTFRAPSAGRVTVKATVVDGLAVGNDYSKIFPITITAIPTPSSGSTSNNTGKAEGKVEKSQQQQDGAPAIKVNNSSDDLKISVLTPEEQKRVAEGENARIILKVTDISASVSDAERKLIQDTLASENGVTENEAGDIPVLYIDLTLYKQVGSQEQTKVTETKDKISISIEVPEELRNTNELKSREFYVLRVHVGEVSRIEGTYDPVTHLFTFETDRFSTYALTYQDKIKIQTYQDFHHLRLTAEAGKTSQTLSYKKIANADGYLIYGSKCGDEMKELANLPADTPNYTIKKLRKGTNYKYQVKAYQIINGEQVIIATSKIIHTITESKKYGNPTKVTTVKASVKLEVGKSITVTGQVVLPKGKKLKEHTAVIRYESSNKEIATVNSKGKISAKAKGICYVYAYAQNGAYKRIKVTVE